jgi:hypothetical protein
MTDMTMADGGGGRRAAVVEDLAAVDGQCGRVDRRTSWLMVAKSQNADSRAFIS